MSNESTKTHWKKLSNPDYIGAYTLMDGSNNGKDLTVTIKSIKREMVIGQDGKKDECTVAQLAGQKPFIINATNSKTITKLYGSPYIEDWLNKKITLFVAKVKVAGDTVDALRIRPTVPKGEATQALPEFTPTHAKWEGAKKAITEGNSTVDVITKNYTLSDDNRILLHSELKARLEATFDLKSATITDDVRSEIEDAIHNNRTAQYLTLLNEIKDL